MSESAYEIQYKQDSDEEVSFTEEIQIDPEATLQTRVYYVQSSKKSAAVVQEIKRKFAEEYNVEYNQLRGHMLNRDGYNVWVSITPRVWDDVKGE